jgi:hypothetical protein
MRIVSVFIRVPSRLTFKSDLWDISEIKKPPSDAVIGKFYRPGLTNFTNS